MSSLHACCDRKSELRDARPLSLRGRATNGSNAPKSACGHFGEHAVELYAATLQEVPKCNMQVVPIVVLGKIIMPNVQDTAHNI